VGQSQEPSGKRSHPRLYNIWTRPGIGKVLVVEPDPDIARMLEVRLAREGHEVLIADTGKLAITTSEQEVIDVALVDKNVADANAFEIIQQLKNMQKPFEALLMSVDPSPELLVKALDHGAFDLVVKPFTNLKIVTAKLKNAVSKVRAERDRDELAHMLAAQTQDLAAREIEAERAGPQGDKELPPEEELPVGLDLDDMSGTDPLTGLPNRKAAEDRFRKETARALRYDRPLCVALGSIDELETVIDRFGAEVADGVLRGIATMFSGMIRDVDFCARRQGGEFFFIFPETAKDSGFIVVDRIRQALSQTSFSEVVGKDTGGFRLTASFGVAGLPTDTMNADLLKDAAENALAAARQSGDRCVMFDSSMARRP
jgi:diguanylate cyclase (GGDEF)-like protein